MQLPINSFDFAQIKANFIQYLKQQGKYTDFNFDASGISSLINIFSYITHYLGYYVNMLFRESSIATAKTKESLYSKSKLNGYIPKGKTSSRASITLTIKTTNANEPDVKQILIPKYSYFNGSNNTNDNRKYYVLDDVLCTTRNVLTSPNIEYVSPEFLVYEGTLRINQYSVSGQQEQRFIIKDQNVDVSTIRVNVDRERNSSITEEYILCENVFSIDNTTPVFYISANNDGLFEIFFGQNTFGKQPIAGNIVKITYLSSSGTEGNGCKDMSYNKPIGNDNTTTSGYNIFKTSIIDVSYGGSDEESIENLKFNIPYHYKRQNRNVLSEDFKAFILDKYQDIDSVHVWGGEDHFEKRYGYVFIALKPKVGKFLSNSQIHEIENNVLQYSVNGQKIKIINPEYISISLSIFFKFDRKKTNKEFGEIKQIISTKIQEYNSTYINKFDTGLSNVDLLSYIKTDNEYITRIYSTAEISKNLTITNLSKELYTVRFGNELEVGSIYSSIFRYSNDNCRIIDDKLGNLFIVNSVNKRMTLKPIGKVDYLNGKLTLSLDENIKSLQSDIYDKQYITITTKTTKPDVETLHNNILLIEKIEVQENA